MIYIYRTKRKRLPVYYLEIYPYYAHNKRCLLAFDGVITIEFDQETIGM